MASPPIPMNEAGRLAALHSYGVLDTACEQSFDIIVRLAARLTGSPIALVSLVDAERQWFKARHGVDATQTPRELAFCAHAVADPERPLVIRDATADIRFADNPLVTGELGIRAYAGIPLVSPDGHALGTLCVVDKEPRDFTPDALDTLNSLAQAVMTALELHRAVRQLQTMALSDPLTGLGNRTALLLAIDAALEAQRRQGRPFALIHLDLDGFRLVNDRHGLATADRVLTVAACALRSTIGKDQTAARLGGDEFAVVLPDADLASLTAFAERVRAAIGIDMATTGLGVTASIGGVAFPHPPSDARQALADANTALNVAKVMGDTNVHCHEHKISSNRTEGGRSEGGRSEGVRGERARSEAA